jgi:hypothetical protein
MLWGSRTPPTVRTRLRGGGGCGGGGARGRCGVVRRGGGGDGSTLGFASSHQFSSSHLVRPPVVPRDGNRVVIIPSSDG